MSFSQKNLRITLEEIARKQKLTALAVAAYDYETGLSFDKDPQRSFHAASTIKLAVLLAYYKAIDDDMVRANDLLHVRNHFQSIVSGERFALDHCRDAENWLYRRVGRRAQLSELAHAMITRSSNLATNLLIDFLGIRYIQQVLERAGVEGVQFVRGVEDHSAYDQGINNEVTAAGLLMLLRKLTEESFLTSEHREAAITTLLAQELNRLIPARLPKEIRVAHKTGEISTACHDAALVIIPNRKPYLLVILTEFKSDEGDPTAAVAKSSRVIFDLWVDPMKTTS